MLINKNYAIIRGKNNKQKNFGLEGSSNVSQL